MTHWFLITQNDAILTQNYKPVYHSFFSKLFSSNIIFKNWNMFTFNSFISGKLCVVLLEIVYLVLNCLVSLKFFVFYIECFKKEIRF